MELVKNGVMKKGIAEKLPAGPGKKKPGTMKQKRPSSLPARSRTATHLSRTLYVPDTALEYMIPGRYETRVIRGRENLFAFVLDSSVVSGIS